MRVLRLREKEYEFAELSRYNAEVARGLVHTPLWRARMRREQERFDIAHKGFHLEEGRA